MDKDCFKNLRKAIRRANQLARQNAPKVAYVLDMRPTGAPPSCGDYAVVTSDRNWTPQDHEDHRTSSVYCVMIG